MAKDEYAITVVSATVGSVVATVSYPQDGRNYWLALTGGLYDVYQVVQEFTGWDADQPFTFGDSNVPLAAGTYTLALRERFKCHGHDMCWRTLTDVAITL